MRPTLAARLAASALVLMMTAVPAQPGWSQARPDSAKAGQKADSAKGGMAGMDHSKMPGMGQPDTSKTGGMAGMPGMAGMGGMRMAQVTTDMLKSGVVAHATPPKDMMLRWKVIRLPGLVNPLRTQGNFQDNLRQGRRVFFENCVLCHGPRLDGQGEFAKALTLTPRALNDPMFLPTHPESYVFWRIAKGAPSLPQIMEPWNSAMPAFEDYLTDEQIWAVVLFLYEQQGFKPGAWMWTEEDMKRGGAHVHVMQ